MGSAEDRLDAAVACALREAGAAVAMLYLLPPGESTLRLAVLAGIPGEIADPWVRVPLSAPIPVSDAVKDRHLVWLGSQEELARRYPRPALVLPYRFALAAAPWSVGRRRWAASSCCGRAPTRPSCRRRSARRSTAAATTRRGCCARSGSGAVR